MNCNSKLVFSPFKAWRYHPERVDLSRVIAPPYDVISPSEQTALYQKSPYNVVRLILGKETNFYEQAARYWEEWTQKGILVQDEKPAIYFYEQAFHHPWDSHSMSRMAVVGVLKLEEPGAVLRHEATFDAPKKDRFLLLEKTKTNLSPIFGLYQNSQRLKRLFSAYRTEPSFFQVHDDSGILHRVWAVSNEEDQKSIAKVLAGEKILIADGHHRYETALEYQRQMRRKFSNLPRQAPFDFVMMALVGEEDDGLLVLPTHRIVRSLGSCPEEELIRKIRDFFDLTACADNKIFSALNAASQDEKVFGVVFQKSGSFLMKLKDFQKIRQELPAGKPPIWYEIEANILTYLVFDKLWGLSDQERLGVVEYTRSTEKAIQQVKSLGAAVSFLMRTPAVDTIRKLAYAGEKMPQKTTYFYPKLASGLLFYRHANA